MEFMSALGSQEDAYRPSLFELVAQEKLRDLLQPAVQYVTAVKERENEALADPHTTRRRRFLIRLIKLFRKVYPYINALYHGSGLVYNVLYLFNKTKYHSPWLHLLGLQIKRMSMADYRAYYDKIDASQSKTAAWSSPLRMFSGVFGKFIEFLKPDPRGTKLPSSPNTCPLCMASPVNNPTALPSGFVFCYTCAYRYVEEHGRCPVSWIKVERGVEDLTKVYADGNL
ncbi:hypothetical protein [Absidia glauca]|uniref:Peroxisome assembly protein 12 n=1 Tax=Absidia glauca TaxID=4829 RepID=A0A163KY16_ABSGL|nr:hypothetical protein [Absidia glauca]